MYTAKNGVCIIVLISFCIFESFPFPENVQILLEMDCILFSLLILKGICDSKGHVWRCHPSHLYVVEVTLPEDVVRVSIRVSIVFLT